MTDLPQFEHERYEELSALATAGALTTEESEALFKHSDECDECSKLFDHYQSLATEGMPLLADLHRPVRNDPGFDEAPALALLLKRAREHRVTEALMPASRTASSPAWRGVAAASAVLGAIFASYQIGEHRQRVTVVPSIAEVSRAANNDHDHRVLEAALDEAKQREAHLRGAVAARDADIDKLLADAKAAREHLDSLSASLTSSKANAVSQIALLTQQRDAAAARVQDAERLYQTALDELNALHSQSEQQSLRLASLEGQLSSLTAELNEQNNRSKSDEQYLASDRDIRDLIGARNLYIADIMDVREDGSSRKPIGRVFYTKTKSLIFYAYDLDRQPGIKKTSTFRVWGRTGPDDRKPLNLGVLYMDSEANRRWTLRVDNPEQLARLDAVFVTVEPRDHSDKPTGKPFLYASLRREPNHP